MWNRQTNKYRFFSLFFLILLAGASCSSGDLEWSTAAAPAVSGASSISSNSDGSRLVAIYGTGFLVGATVTVDGHNCTGVNVISSTTIQCTIPSGVLLVNIVVTNPGSGSSSSGSSPSASAYYTIFVTSAQYVGMGTQMTLKGQLIADLSCQSLASVGTKTSGISGKTWRALISTFQSNAKDRLSLGTEGAIKNTLGETAFSDKSKLFTTSLLANVKYNENGAAVAGGAGGQVAGSEFVWTFSDSNGNRWNESLSAYCPTGMGASAAYGSVLETGSSWLAHSTADCSNSMRIYCIDSDN